MRSLAQTMPQNNGALLSTERTIGHSADRDGRYCRVVDSLTVFDEPLDFRSLCARVIGANTDYLVMDLDRTTHLDRNLGELLGWEIEAYRAYGMDRLNALDANRVLERLFLDPRTPLRTLAYLLNGVASWAYPGLTYLFGVKLASRMPRLEKWTYRQFGPEAVTILQRCIQTAMLHKVAGLNRQDLYHLAERVWNRVSDDQVIEREDITWLRSRFPRLRIVITSASPQPMLEVARNALDVDDVLYSGATETEDSFQSPFHVNRCYRTGPLDQLSTPENVTINSGRQKIERLIQQFPNFGRPDCNVVGISDTRHGEDHCWAQFFTRVVDVNSNAPYAPIVAHDSPLRDVYSARLLSRSQRRGNREIQGMVGPIRRIEGDALRNKLGSHVNRIEAHAREYAQIRTATSEGLDSLERAAACAVEDIANAVEYFNGADESTRSKGLQALRSRLRDEARLRRAHAKLHRPLSMHQYAIVEELRDARSQIDASA
jgi:hypothetical protein